ncbi:hypothetical protein G7066_01615 [Leucobacter coleopterorum]|uniref:Uncharacterized protein n=1 Tax=Leucobacter coleopterorum TaxID=2714933 RepID=A0ABX6JTX0_9MICO|nr:hypothetical protein [Leucobacter coleopterorum]QIM17725.1 hypothetical protein G7066_01615 [Leucobacter coleopterorum]
MTSQRLAAVLSEFDFLGKDEMHIGSSGTKGILATPAITVIGMTVGYFAACWQAGAAVCQVMNAYGRVAHDRLEEHKQTLL